MPPKQIISWMSDDKDVLHQELFILCWTTLGVFLWILASYLWSVFSEFYDLQDVRILIIKWVLLFVDVVILLKVNFHQMQ